MAPTRSQVNRAGETLRSWIRGEIDDEPAIERALRIALAYRALHAYPLTKATMGVRSVIGTERCRLEVSQRLKRMTTILDKLRREPTIRLAQMQDIAGCRAVLADIAELRRVERRLKKNRPPLRYSDYISSPRGSGYRSVHVVVGYPDEEGEQRAVEVQLRTQTMHEWAITVERLSGQLRDDLKSGRGPAPLLEWLAAVSEAMAIEESGNTVPPALHQRIGQLRLAAAPSLAHNGRPQEGTNG
ncbi:MAG: RelA/SpoT domain-containing protein [Candidatus Dormibacteria bacterium]